MRLRHLEMALEGLSGFDRPDASREQYTTPAVIAARLLYDAALAGDITDRRVLDLGCGTGVLSIGAALLGAAEVTGTDIDRSALASAVKNAEAAGVRVAFYEWNLSMPLPEDVETGVDTVVMNPPFGAQRRHADRVFYDRALESAGIVWTVLNRGTIPFLRTYLAGRAEIDKTVLCKYPMKRSFKHHQMESKEIEVEIARLIRLHQTR